MKKLVFACILLFLLTITAVDAMAEQIDGRTLHIFHTGESFTVKWDDPTSVILYTELKLFHYEQNENVLLPSALAKVPYQTTQVTFVIPRWGHWIISARHCHESLDKETQCTEWSDSTNAEVATVDGKPQAWWVYTYIAPVS